MDALSGECINERLLELKNDGSLINALPNELIVGIFSYLQDARDCFALYGVCTRWKELIGSWQDITQKALSDKASIKATNILAIMYLLGIRVEANEKLGFQFASLSAEKIGRQTEINRPLEKFIYGHAKYRETFNQDYLTLISEAQCCLPKMYTWVEKGKPFAIYSIGLAFHHIDKMEAIDILTIAAKNNFCSANLALYHLDNKTLKHLDPIKEKSAEALFLCDQVKDSAKMGDSSAQYSLAFSLYKKQKFIKSLKWFFKSANQGNVGSQIMLGYLSEQIDQLISEGGLAIEKLECSNELKHYKYSIMNIIRYYIDEGCLDAYIHGLECYTRGLRKEEKLNFIFIGMIFRQILHFTPNDLDFIELSRLMHIPKHDIEAIYNIRLWLKCQKQIPAILCFLYTSGGILKRNLNKAFQFFNIFKHMAEVKSTGKNQLKLLVDALSEIEGAEPLLEKIANSDSFLGLHLNIRSLE